MIKCLLGASASSALSSSGHEEQTGIGTTQGRFYSIFPMEGRVSMLGCLSSSRTVSFCFSFGHVARYAPSRKAKAYCTIAEDSSQTNL